MSGNCLAWRSRELGGSGEGWEKQTILEERIVPTLRVKRNKNFRSAIGRSGAHHRKLRTTFYSTTTFSLE
jgi:hypothetical protein